MSSCTLCRKSWINQDIKMFHVPINLQKRQLWNRACGEELRDSAKICELHFLKSDIILHDKRRRLKNNALPILRLHVTTNNVATKADERVDGQDENSQISVDSSNIEFITDEECEGTGIIESNSSPTPSDTILIDEALFDETLPATATMKVIQKGNVNCSTTTTQTGSENMEACAIIALTLSTDIYSITCFHCDVVIPLWNWSEFVKHMKEKHINVEENSKKLEDCKISIHSEEDSDDYGNYEYNFNPDTAEMEETVIENVNQEDNASVASYEDEEGNTFMDEAHLQEHQFKHHQMGELPFKCETVTENVNQEALPKANEDNASVTIYKEEEGSTLVGVDILNMQIEGEYGKIDEIRYGITDDELVLDFLSMLKTYPILYAFTQDSKEAYESALMELASILNRKWGINLTDTSLNVSLNRIKNWYQTICGKSKDGRIRCRYPKFFEKCSQFLPTSNEHATKPLRVPCDICKRLFMDEAHLQVHQFKHHQMGELPYKCCMCEHRFASNEALVRHENYHNREKKFVCNECNKSFYLERYYKAHLIVHQICNVCGKKCTSRGMYVMHKTTHEPPKYKCEICSKLYFRKEKLDGHLRLHRNERNYVCDQCGKAFVRQGSLAVHKQLHSDEKQYACAICNMAFKTAQSRSIHRTTHHLVLEGTNEQLTASRSGQVTPDSLRVYTRHTYVIDPATKTKRLGCDQCENTYSRHGGLTVHKINAHGYVPLRKRQKMHAKVINNLIKNENENETSNEFIETDESGIATTTIEHQFDDIIEHDDDAGGDDDAEIDNSYVLYDNIMASY